MTLAEIENDIETLATQAKKDALAEDHALIDVGARLAKALFGLLHATATKPAAAAASPAEPAKA